jgi:5-deoxy-5-amino-3-dehydroquinate synthase
MVKVHVSLSTKPYDVTIGPGVRHELGAILEATSVGYQSCVVVTSKELRAQSWFDVDHDDDVTVIEVPEGERAKTFGSLASLCEQFAALQLSRRDVIVAVGGGALTDVAGFAAAVYLRGISVIHIPTTLVGQVDAAIGGKTAINLPSGKNLVGAFHQPVAVLCDSEILESLPDRERQSGFGEVAKCWLLEDRRASALASASLDDLILLSVNLKARIVATDEFESGERALLNYGHTLAHALEVLALAHDPDLLRHGEAVGIGLGFAVRLAHALGRVDELVVANHDEVLAFFKLSLEVPKEFSTSDIIAAMGHDKKAHHDLTFVLPGVNGFEVVRGVNHELVVRVLEEYREAR